MLGALMQVDGAQAADPSETVAVEVAGITETAGGDELPLGLLGAGIGVSAADQVDTDPEDDITSTTVVDVPPTDVTAPPPTTISTPAAEVLPAAPTTVPVTTTTLPADRGEAALALMRPANVVLVAIAFGAVRVGGVAIKGEGVPASIADIIQALILLGALGAAVFTSYTLTRRGAAS